MLLTAKRHVLSQISLDGKGGGGGATTNRSMSMVKSVAETYRVPQSAQSALVIKGAFSSVVAETVVGPLGVRVMVAGFLHKLPIVVEDLCAVAVCRVQALIGADAAWRVGWRRRQWRG